MAYLEGDRTGSSPQLADARLAGEQEQEGLRLLAWLPLAIAAALLLAWEVAARAGWVPALFFPAPSTIARTTVKLGLQGTLLQNTGITLLRITLGVLIGGSLGALLGLVMGMSRPLRRVVEPFVSAAHPIPKVAIFPLILIMFGVGESSKVAVVALAAFFPMLISTMNGVSQIQSIYFEVARNYGAGRRQEFTRVVLPGSLPSMLTGLLLALNIALLLCIAVEMISASQGLGAMIWMSWQTLRTEELYAALLVIVVLGISFNVLFHRLLRRLVPWQPER
jgi:NitT/TauT family transport system permease protein